MLTNKQTNNAVANIVNFILQKDSSNLAKEEMTEFEKMIASHLSDENVLNEELLKFNSVDVEAAYKKFEISTARRKTKIRIKKTVAFAAVAAMLIGIVLLINTPNNEQSITVKNENISSTSNTVILKTEDGKEYATTGDIKVDESGASAKGTELIADNEALTSRLNTVVTPKGIRQELTLSDGTVVWLNAETSLSFPTNFTGNTRNVYLDGEAYFDVKHDEKAFIVNSESRLVKVFGTSFCINSYSNQHTSDVALYTGSVQVSTPSGSTMLQPGFHIEINNRSHVISPQIKNMSNSPDWMRGRMEFYAEPLSKVFNTIERWYGVEVVFDNSMMYNEITISVSDQISLIEFVELLNTTQRVSITIKGNKLYVTKRNP